MKPSIQTLGQILYSPSQYVIPVFQRNYRWEAPQWAKLWDSLLEIQRPDKRGNHFMGFLVFVPGLAQPGQHTTFYLIDGQQRLTTSTILLAAVRNVAQRLGQDDLADEVHQYYLVHPLKKGEQHYRLLPKERDHDSYLALISRKGEPTGRIADAIAYFEEQMEAEGAARLRGIFDTVCQRFEFMCATLEAENAYNIFKSLNSTGVPLGASDLIRNFVFMRVPPHEQEQFDHDLWAPLEHRFARPDSTLDEDRFSQFFRDFLMSGGRYVTPKETFHDFEARYEATELSPVGLAEELTASATDYAAISGRTEDENGEVARALAGLNILESSTTYPLLLALFRDRAAGRIDSARLAHAIDMLRGFILRRFICGESSRGYGQMFVRAVGKNMNDPVKDLEAYLLDRGWPDDSQFVAAFVDFPLYLRGYSRQVLDTLERSRGHKEPADLDSAQVEHILPQKLSGAWTDALGPEAERIHGEWLHRPGNLALSAYNPELLNHPFSKKRERYGQSNIGITRELAGYERWGEEEIRARGQRLAQEALRIWIGPRERPPVEVDDDDSTDRRELRQRFWGGLADFLAMEKPDLPRPEAKPYSTVRIPSGLRHVGLELRFGLRHRQVGLDLYFWREPSFAVWERIRTSPEEYDALLDANWGFEQLAQHRGRMYLDHAADPRNEATWPELFSWLCGALSLVYARAVPKLREEMDRRSPQVG